MFVCLFVCLSVCLFDLSCCVFCLIFCTYDCFFQGWLAMYAKLMEHMLTQYSPQLFWRSFDVQIVFV